MIRPDAVPSSVPQARAGQEQARYRSTTIPRHAGRCSCYATVCDGARVGEVMVTRQKWPRWRGRGGGVWEAVSLERGGGLSARLFYPPICSPKKACSENEIAPAARLSALWCEFHPLFGVERDRAARLAGPTGPSRDRTHLHARKQPGNLPPDKNPTFLLQRGGKERERERRAKNFHCFPPQT